METKNENLLKIPSQENFKLVKVKMLKHGDLDVHFESYGNKYHIEIPEQIHSDFQNCFIQLKIIVSKIFDLWGLNSNDIEKEIERFLEKIEVRGITLSGQGDNIGVIINFLFQVSIYEQTVPINTPRIKFKNQTYAFEKELEQIIQCIENEVYLFLFQGKKAELSVFDPSSVD